MNIDQSKQLIRDAARRRYLEAVFGLMDGPGAERIASRALAVVALWERAGVHPTYIHQWRELLAGDVEAMRSVVLADDPQAEALRHCMPFAGILSNRQRAELRKEPAPT